MSNEFFHAASTAPQGLCQHTWGSSLALEESPRHCLVKVTIAPGQGLPAHYHQHRSKRLLVLSGILHVDIDGQVHRLRAGEGLSVALEQVHAMNNPSVAPVQFYEVQSGDYFGAEDVTFV